MKKKNKTKSKQQFCQTNFKLAKNINSTQENRTNT